MKNFDEVDKPLSNASIHGVVTSILPVKKGQTGNNLMEQLVMAILNCMWFGFRVAQQKISVQLTANTTQ